MKAENECLRLEKERTSTQMDHHRMGVYVENTTSVRQLQKKLLLIITEDLLVNNAFITLLLPVQYIKHPKWMCFPVQRAANVCE